MALNTDVPYTTPLENRWIRAKNILLADDYKTPVNEPGDSLIATTNGSICGVISTPKEAIIFTDTNFIYRLRDDILTPIVESSKFNFGGESPITGVYKYNNYNELIVAWTDGVNEPCILNVDNLPFTIDPQHIPSILTPAGCDADDYFSLVNFFPYVKYPKFTNIVLNHTGNLTKGVYYVFVQYGYGNGNWTSWSSICSDPISIGEDNKAIVANATVTVFARGIEEAALSNVLTTANGNSFTFTFTDIDTKFKEFRYGFVYTDLNNITDACVSEVIQTAGITFNTYTLTENINKVGYSTILSDYMFFRYCESVETFKNDLLAAGITTFDEYDYQKYANNIKAKYVHKHIRNEFVITQKLWNLHKTYMPDEVYGFNIHLVHKRGFVSKGYHIPLNITAAYGFTWFNTEYLTGATTTADPYKYYQLKPATYDNTGHFCIWVNQNEFYPNTESSDIWDSTGKIGSLREQSVRHHKFPPVDFFESTPNNWEAVLGVKFEDVYIPPAIANELQGYFFSHYLRNSPTILDMGIALTKEVTSGTHVGQHMNGQYEFHSFGLQANKPALSNGIFQKLTNANRTVLYGSTSTVERYKITEISYVPANNRLTTPSNGEKEEYIYINTSEAFTGYVANQYSYLANIKYVSNNLYIDKSSLLLAKCTDVFPVTDTSTTDSFKGDCFLNTQAYSMFTAWNNRSITTYDAYSSSDFFKAIALLQDTTAWYDPTTITGTPQSDLTFYYPIVYSKVNSIKGYFAYDVNRRYISYLPNTIFRTVSVATDSTIDNWRQFDVSRYYTLKFNKGRITLLLVQKNKLFIFTDNELYTAVLHDTIKTPDGNTRLQQSDIFDYDPEPVFDSSYGIGGLVDKCAAIKFSLGIVYIDVHNAKIYTIIGELDEITKYGIQNEIKSFLNAYYAGVTLVSETGVKLIAESGVELVSSVGSQTRVSSLTSPFLSMGCTIGCDEVNKRFLFTFNYTGTSSLKLPITYSFCYATKEWIANHDYTPTSYFNTRDGFYTTYITTILKQLSNDVGNMNGGVVDSYLDMLYFNPPFEAKYHESVRWQTETKDDNGNIIADELFRAIVVYNDYQCSGEVALTLKSSTVSSNNTDIVNGVFYFNAFKDNVVATPFIDINGDLIAASFNAYPVLVLSAYTTYELYNCSAVTDYVTYGTRKYYFNKQRFTTTNVTTVTIAGNAKLKQVKNVLAKARFISPYVVVRYIWNNVTTNITKLLTSNVTSK